MRNCDICGALTENEKHITKNWLRPYIPYSGPNRILYEEEEVPIYYCEVCESFVKRTKYFASAMNDISTKTINHITNLYDVYSNMMNNEKNELAGKIQHLIDIQFKQTEVQIMDCLKELDKPLEEKGI